MADEAHPINIGVLSLGWDESIEHHLMSTIRTCKTEVKFISLDPTDLNEYTAPVNLNAVILLHPNTEGRLSLTDVPDARYKTLLPTLEKQYGRDSICVIAYLVKDLKEHTYQTRLQMMKLKQPTVFDNSSCVILCGKLEDIFHHDVDKIKLFVKNQWGRFAEQPWQDSWFELSKETQPNHITRAMENLKGFKEQEESENGSYGSEQDIHNITSVDQQLSPIKEQAGKPSRNADGNTTRPKIRKNRQLGVPNIRDSGRNLQGQDRTAKRPQRTRSFKAVRKDFIKKEPESTPNDVFGFEDLATKKPNDAGSSQCVVLVTDASGFVASHIVLELLRNGYIVRVALSKTAPNDFIHFLERVMRNPKEFKENISEADCLKEIVQGCTYVIHAADMFPEKADKFTDGKMTSRVTQLLRACVNDDGVKRVIVAGSCECAKGIFSNENDPTKVWVKLENTLKDAYWKALTEKEALQFDNLPRKAGQKIELSIIRSPIVMGPIFFHVDMAKVEMVRRLQDDKNARDIHFPMCDVRDVVKAYILALNCKTAKGKYVSVTHQVISFERMQDIIRKKIDPEGTVFKRKISSYGRIKNETTKALDKLYSDKKSYSHRENCPVLVNSPIPLETTVMEMVSSYVDRRLINFNP